MSPTASRTTSPVVLPALWQQVRWRILLLLLLITIINFVDRQSLSIVAPILRDTLRLTNTDYGIIVAAFQMGMMLGEFPMGLLMDRRGARFGLSFAVLWWSLANGLHAMATSMLQFSALRFWLGTGECGNYSGGLKVVSQWFPVTERAFAIGVFNSGSMLGSIVAPPLLVWLTIRFGWHSAFVLPAVLGLLWVAAWARFYRSPETHPDLSAAERAYIQQDDGTADSTPPSSAALLRVPHTWGLMLCRLLVGPVVQFYLYWLPEYLYRDRGLSLKEIGLFAWLPFLFGDLGSMGGGWMAGLLLRRGWTVPQARRWTMTLGAVSCQGSLAVAGARSAPAALAWICFVLFGHTFLSANMFAAVSDLFPRGAVGRVTALTGIAGGLGGMLFPLLTGRLVDQLGYRPVFAIAALLPLAGCLALFALTRKWTGRFVRA